MSAADWQALRDVGVDVVRTPTVFQTLLRHHSTRRDHRKLLVVDSASAFTGGMSVDDTFFRPAGEPTWRESMVWIEGPVVREMQRAFDEAWRGYGGRPTESNSSWDEVVIGVNARVVLSTPSCPTGESLFVAALRGARQSVWITNAFVVPSERISTAITEAAQNGIDVRLLVPGRFHRFGWVREAMRGFYDRYVHAGVRIFEYEAAMLHAKTITVDDGWACVGSFNLDPRSFASNDEIAVAACDGEFARRVAEVFARDCANAVEIQLSDWRRRGLMSRLREAAAKPLRDYL
jgi:cardiolipin synthase